MVIGILLFDFWKNVFLRAIFAMWWLLCFLKIDFWRSEAFRLKVSRMTSGWKPLEGSIPLPRFCKRFSESETPKYFRNRLTRPWYSLNLWFCLRNDSKNVPMPKQGVCWLKLTRRGPWTLNNRERRF